MPHVILPVNHRTLALGLFLTSVIRPLDRFASLVVILCMAVLTSVIFIQVVLRYGFNSSLDWGWEVPRLCFIATIFLAIPLGLKSGAHVGIGFLGALIPPQGQRVLTVVQTALSIGLMAIVAVYAVVLAIELWDQLMPTLNLSVGLFYAILAFSAVHSILHLLNGALAQSLLADAPSNE